jgi:tetratricopeptide (TPR) repeat protein
MTVEGQEPRLDAEIQQHLTAAYAYESTGELKKALRRCKTTIELAPDHAEIYNLQGIILEQLGHREQAIFVLFLNFSPMLSALSSFEQQAGRYRAPLLGS